MNSRRVERLEIPRDAEPDGDRPRLRKLSGNRQVLVGRYRQGNGREQEEHQDNSPCQEASRTEPPPRIRKEESGGEQTQPKGDAQEQSGRNEGEHGQAEKGPCSRSGEAGGKHPSCVSQTEGERYHA